MAKKYHLYSRTFSSKATGKEYRTWYYWYWQDGQRIRKPAGPNGAPRLKREAQAYVDALEEVAQATVDAAPPPPPLPRPARPAPSRRNSQAADAPRADMTLRDFAADLFLPGALHLRRREMTEGAPIKESTRKSHRAHLDLYIVPKWGDLMMSRIDDRFADRFLDWLVDLECAEVRIDGKLKRAARPMANSTRNGITETMAMTLREARRDRLIARVPEFERVARRSARQDTLTDSELAALFPESYEQLEKIWTIADGRDHGTGILFGAMCCLGVSAGLRSGELRAVTMDQLVRRTLPSGQVLWGLIVDKMLDDKLQIAGLKKSKKDDPKTRAVPLSEKTVRILSMYLDRIGERDGFLFLHRGEPVRKETLGRRWAAGLVNARVDTSGRRLTPHAMRYTFNSRMRPILSESVLHQVIGHSSEGMTEHYDRPHMEERLLRLADHRGAFDKFWE